MRSGRLGAHSKFENLAIQEYHCLEYREEFCEALRQLFPADRVRCGDIHRRQPWPDGYFDRIIAIHVLEHPRNLPVALTEIRRLRPRPPFAWLSRGQRSSEGSHRDAKNVPAASVVEDGQTTRNAVLISRP